METYWHDFRGDSVVGDPRWHLVGGRGFAPVTDHDDVVHRGIRPLNALIARVEDTDTPEER
ncbi:hypothetical protein AB0J51_08025 [Micromonospora echinofusca]|uniref:hypothetical protein n=1 Tax=Micromonospora echinofusca TaxID=47858 RepID=UPI0034445328